MADDIGEGGLVPRTDTEELWRQKFDVEAVKRSGIEPNLERLEHEGYEALTPEEFYRLKMQGVCSQRTPGLHMIRIRIPGGRMTVAELRGLKNLSLEHADGGAHITTRQNLELHDVASVNVRSLVAGLSAIGLTTRSTCGHTVRNIMGCTRSGICAEEPFDTRATVEALHAFYLANSAHYNARLPRRINVSVAGCAGCMPHAQMNDLGFVACTRDGEHGFQLWCAGSFASNPRLAHLLFGFVPADEAVALAQAVTDVYCEHGFRDRPAKARMKFLLAEWGEDRFAETVLERLRQIRPGARTSRQGPPPVLGEDRRRGGETKGIRLQRQDGFVGIEARVALGDLSGSQMSALADLAETFGDGIVWFTREQNAELHWVRAEDAEEVARALREARLWPEGAGSLVDVQVCAGTEWCIWGVGDSRGMARDIERSLSTIVAMDPVAEPLRVHISGCAHGCAQHAAADVGLASVGVRDVEGARAEGFELFGGGRLGIEPRAAARLGKVPRDVAPSKLVKMLVGYVAEREPGEDFASYLDRTGSGEIVKLEDA